MEQYQLQLGLEQTALLEAQTAAQVLQLRQQYWQHLFLRAVEMSEAELRAELRHRSADRRFAAAFVVGDRLLEWPDDLIPLLQDQSEGVRQAARRSLIVLSFLALNPQEAALLRSPVRTRPPTPLSELQSPVDFGPAPGAPAGGRAEAVARWKEWWAGRRPRQLETNPGPSGVAPPESERLADALVKAGGERRQELLAQYRDTKGVQYSEALALTIARESGEGRQQLRDALARRMARMTDRTLGEYLRDEDAELRRAAALGAAARGKTEHLGRVIDLLLDAQPAVGRAAHAALCRLSGEDFGPRVNATERERTEAAARWRRWLRDRPRSP
jgi:hypothetical protein